MTEQSDPAPSEPPGDLIAVAPADASAAPAAPEVTEPAPPAAPLEADPGPPTLTLAARALLLATAEAASVALGVWTLRLGDAFLPYALSNQLGKTARLFAVLNMAVAGAVVALGALVFMLVRRNKGGVRVVHAVAFRCAPLALVGLLPALLDWRIWKDRRVESLLLDAAFALGMQALVRLSLAAPPVWPETLRARVSRLRLADVLRRLARSRHLPLVITLIGAAGYAIYFSAITIANHDRLGTSSFDLGLEENIVWNAIHGGRLFKSSPFCGPDCTHAGNHQTYFAYLIGLVYLLAPTPKTLLVIQSVMMGGAAVPLYLYAARRVAPWTAAAVALAYLLYPPLHGANLYDFHYLPLGPLLLWLMLHLLQQRRDGWAALVVVLALSVREDVGALMAVLGLLLVMIGERPKAGALVMAAGGLTFGVLKFVVMPQFAGGESFVHQYKYLIPSGEHSFGSVLKTVVANPVYTVQQLVDLEKLIYVFQILTPLAFLPLRRGTALLACLPGFVFTLLSTDYRPLVEISFQYTTYWTAMLFPVVVLNLQAATERSRRAWTAAIVAGTLLTSYQFGAVLQHHTARGGFGWFEFHTSDQDRDKLTKLRELVAQVPARAKIVASEPLVPHVAARPDAYTLRFGIYDADWLLFSVSAGGDERRHVLEAFDNESFGVVDVRGEFVLAQRGHDRAKNADVLRRLGR